MTNLVQECSCATSLRDQVGQRNWRARFRWIRAKGHASAKSAACLLVCTVKIQTYPNHGSSQTNRKYIINANGVRQGHGMHPTLNKRRLAQDNHKLFYALCFSDLTDLRMQAWQKHTLVHPVCRIHLVPLNACKLVHICHGDPGYWFAFAFLMEDK